MLEDLGNCVRIHDTVIPAVNIQIEGFPKFIGDDWYGIYFEILVEDGGLYIVSQYHQDGLILVENNPFWGGGDGDKDFCIPKYVGTWEEFVVFWNVRQEEDEDYRRVSRQLMVLEMRE